MHWFKKELMVLFIITHLLPLSCSVFQVDLIFYQSKVADMSLRTTVRAKTSCKSWFIVDFIKKKKRTEKLYMWVAGKTCHISLILQETPGNALTFHPPNNLLKMLWRFLLQTWKFEISLVENRVLPNHFQKSPFIFEIQFPLLLNIQCNEMW